MQPKNANPAHFSSTLMIGEIVELRSSTPLKNVWGKVGEMREKERVPVHVASFSIGFFSEAEHAKIENLAILYLSSFFPPGKISFVRMALYRNPEVLGAAFLVLHDFLKSWACSPRGLNKFMVSVCIKTSPVDLPYSCHRFADFLLIQRQSSLYIVRPNFSVAKAEQGSCHEPAGSYLRYFDVSGILSKSEALTSLRTDRENFG